MSSADSGDRRRATLSDVAQRAGVSVTTASYVLNGRGEQMRISADAARRVLTASEELAYRPNRSARNLRTATTKTFGMITVRVASGHFANEMLSGAAAAALAGEHLLLIGETEGDPDLTTRLVNELVDRQVDGIIYATMPHSRVTLPPALRDVPVVLLNCVDPDERLPAVVPDEHAGGVLAARTVVGTRSDLVVHVVGEDPTPEALAGPGRLAGLREELARIGATFGDLVPCAWDVRPAYDAVSGWLRGGARPEALVCLNDRVAMGAYQAIAEAGLAVPDDVSVVAFDGSSLATWLRPQVTSVALPYAEMGAQAVDLLMARGTGVHRVAMPLMPGHSVPAAVGSVDRSGLPGLSV